MQPFDDVVTRHGARVLRVCRAVLGPDDADDAWSETFLAALRAYPDLSPGTDLEAWLVTVAHRKAIDVLRGRARRPVPVAHVPDVPTDRPGPEMLGQHEELYAALASLSEKQRLCVAYHHLGGLPHREVAALVGGSEEAARRAAADGVKTLRTRFARQQEVAP